MASLFEGLKLPSDRGLMKAKLGHEARGAAPLAGSDELEQRQVARAWIASAGAFQPHRHGEQGLYHVLNVFRSRFHTYEHNLVACRMQVVLGVAGEPRPLYLLDSVVIGYMIGGLRPGGHGDVFG